MIRRHLTPALLAFLSLLFCCFTASAGPGTWRVAAAAAIAMTGGAITLLACPGASDRRWRAGLLLFGAAAGVALGAASQNRMWASFSGGFLPMPDSQVTEVSGVVTEDSVLTQRGETAIRIELSAVSSSRRGIAARARGGMLLFVPADVRFSIGERLSARATPEALPPLRAEKWVARVAAADVRSLGFSHPLWAARAQTRDWLHRSVSRIGYPASALLEALLVGVRQDVPPDLYQGFARTGSLHILALSGLHVTVIFGAAAALLWFLRRPGLRFLAAAAVLLVYQVIVGFMPSLLRATVMILIGGAGLLLDRDREPLNVLALSGIVLVLIDPFQAFTISFQLSFLALAGILVLAALLRRPLASRLPRFLLASLAMSAGAQAATLPLVIGQFGTWYPSGLAANLVLVPLTTGYLWAGLAWLPVSAIPWPALHDLCAAGFGAFYRVIQVSADFFARVPGLVFPPAAVPWLAGGAAIVVTAAAALLPWKRANGPLSGTVPVRAAP